MSLSMYLCNQQPIWRWIVQPESKKKKTKKPPHTCIQNLAFTNYNHKNPIHVKRGKRGRSEEAPTKYSVNVSIVGSIDFGSTLNFTYYEKSHSKKKNCKPTIQGFTWLTIAYDREREKNQLLATMITKGEKFAMSPFGFTVKIPLFNLFFIFFKKKNINKTKNKIATSPEMSNKAVVPCAEGFE